MTGDALPFKSLRVTLVLTKSSVDLPILQHNEYGMMLTVAPVSTSILLMGLPLMKPFTNRGFKC